MLVLVLSKSKGIGTRRIKRLITMAGLYFTRKTRNCSMFKIGSGFSFIFVY